MDRQQFNRYREKLAQQYLYTTLGPVITSEDTIDSYLSYKTEYVCP